MNYNFECLVCPDCKKELIWQRDQANCFDCNLAYAVRDNIPVFTKKAEYWCNVPAKTMLNLIRDVEDSGDWLTASKRHIPHCTNAFVPSYRADAQFLFPITNDSVILDAGSMWGGLTIPMAQYCKKVYAVDKTWETLRFLQARSKQMKLDNIVPITSGLSRLPFPDNFFDFIVVNGVLEWLGMDESMIIDEHWSSKHSNPCAYAKTPTDMQRAALMELYRVTKPGGGIYVAIENRIGLQYFLGHPDDHINVRFAPLMPRKLANIVVKKLKGTEYRTYIYTPRALRELLQSAGYEPRELFSIYPHYGKISRAIPFELFKPFKHVATTGYSHIKIYILSYLWRFIPATIGKHMAPSLALIASKGHLMSAPKLLGLLSEALHGFNPEMYKLLLCNNRFNNENPTNYLVYSLEEKKVKYFCKVARTKNDQFLINESNLLKEICDVLSSTSMSESVPQIVRLIEQDDVVIQVTKFVNAEHIDDSILNKSRSLGKLAKDNVFIFSVLSRVSAIARNIWLKTIDSKMIQAINWLVEFQKATVIKSGIDDEIIDDWVHLITTRMNENNFSNALIEKAAKKSKALLKSQKNKLFTTIQHGDYDICNVMIECGRVFIVDFEHAEKHAFPFFDLGNLIFSPVVSEWKINGKNKPLRDYVNKTAWRPFLKKWLLHYSKLTGISMELLKYMPMLAALEQNSKQYPAGRDAYDYPMYGQSQLEEMIDWVLEV